MKASRTLGAAIILAGLAISSNAFAGRGNTGETGPPDWAGKGNGATFEVTTVGNTGTTTGAPTGGTGTGDDVDDPAANPFILMFTQTTPSGNVHTRTMTYGVNAEGQNVLLEMQKLFTNHNGHVVEQTRVFGTLPAPIPDPATDPSTDPAVDPAVDPVTGAPVVAP